MVGTEGTLQHRQVIPCEWLVYAATSLADLEKPKPTTTALEALLPKLRQQSEAWHVIGNAHERGCAHSHRHVHIHTHRAHTLIAIYPYAGKLGSLHRYRLGGIFTIFPASPGPCGLRRK